MNYNKNKKYKLAVFIGRFQPAHEGHLRVIRQALQMAEVVLILIGSAYRSSDPKNPWKWEDRSSMLRDCFNAEDNSRIVTNYIIDYMYNDPKWLMQVQTNVAAVCEQDSEIVLVGHHKDESSYYLDMFPQWDQCDLDNFNLYNSTDIRNVYFDRNQTQKQWDTERAKMAPVTADYLDSVKDSDFYLNLVDEADFYREHTEMWSGSPYKVRFITGDAFVVQAGHVLLIERDNCPGRGQLALPGGYLDDERTIDCAIRELREETKLKIPEPVLRGSQFASKVFDHPHRSLRGHIVTHAYGFHLDNLDATGNLQEIRAASDARSVTWVPLYKFDDQRYRANMFEDHGDIVQYFIDNMKKEWK